VEKVKAHIELFNDLKKKFGSKKPHIVLQYLINRHNEGEIHKTREYAVKIGAEFFPTPIMLDITNRAQRDEWLPRDDNLTLYDREKQIKKKASPQQSCGFLWNDPVINVDGGVAPCCHLFHKSMDFGCLGQESFSDIWNNASFIRSRRIFKTRTVQSRTIACERCVNPRGFYDPYVDLINEYKTNQLK
jgi:radical SAM protein with 4Fe4S-binding SPASM domain